MPRVLFEKTGSAIWISHLDLMRVFQRSFRRAGMMLKHTQGYSPRAIVSIALPLSVGVESRCELLDIELEGDAAALPPEEIARRLNEALPAGVRALKVYDQGRKLKELTHLQAEVLLEYDQGVPQGAAEAIRALFSGESVLVDKHSKKGETQVDLLPMLKSLSVRASDRRITLEAVCCAQNPSLNPALLAAAVARYLPELAPSFSMVRRLEVLDAEGRVFR